MQKRTKAAALGGVTLAGIWAGTTQPAYADQDSSGTLYQTSTQDCLHYDDQFLANGGNPDRWTSTSSAQYASSVFGVYTSKCHNPWNRPPGNLKVRMRMDGPVGDGCFDTGDYTNPVTVSDFEVYSDGMMNYCGAGWIQMSTWNYEWNGDWHGGYVPHAVGNGSGPGLK